MAFPGTYNINYYKGDTFEFRIYPKDSAGAAFDITNYTPVFTIASARGSAGVVGKITAYSAKSTDGTYILCAIRPSDGISLNAANTYVYDVQITDPDTNNTDEIYYDKVFTILTGTISVTDHVSGAV